VKRCYTPYKSRSFLVLRRTPYVWRLLHVTASTKVSPDAIKKKPSILNSVSAPSSTFSAQQYPLTSTHQLRGDESPPILPLARSSYERAALPNTASGHLGKASSQEDSRLCLEYGHCSPLSATLACPKKPRSHGFDKSA